MVNTASVAVMPLFSRSQYRIIGQIGQGQFGRVYCALSRTSGKMYALKDLEHRVFPTNKFLREVSYLVILRHPNVVACHGLEYHTGGRYLVMDYCEGGTLRDIIDGDGDLCVAGKIDIVRQILLGLDQAHRRNIIHCDLKPDNILLVPRTRGWQVKVSDFGIARLTENTGNPNFGKGYTGSPAYMAPERFYGKFSVASDIYAVGILLYELIVGDRPFTGFPKALQSAHLNQQLKLPPGFPSLLEPIVQKALKKLPQQRYLSANTMAEALKKAQQSYLEQHPPQGKAFLYAQAPPATLPFEIAVKHRTPLFFAVRVLVCDGSWVYLANGRELYLWQYGDRHLDSHPLPRWSLEVPGIITNLAAAAGEISLLVRGLGQKSWEFYQWTETLLKDLHLPKPRIRLTGEKLVSSLSLGGKNLTTVTAEDVPQKGCLQVWNTARGIPVAPAKATLFPSQLLTIDQRHGLLVQLVQTSRRCRSIFYLFNRRGGMIPAFQLSFLVCQLVVNRYSRNHLFGLAYDNNQTGVLIRLQPLKINRIGLNLHPKFIESFPWGYLLAAQNGQVALLDYEGYLFGNFDLGETITAIAPVDRYLCLIATWQGGEGNLLLVDLGEKVESIIKDRQEER